jgi:hypothetical protein
LIFSFTDGYVTSLPGVSREFLDEDGMISHLPELFTHYRIPRYAKARFLTGYRETEGGKPEARRYGLPF